MQPEGMDLLIEMYNEIDKNLLNSYFHILVHSSVKIYEGQISRLKK